MTCDYLNRLWIFLILIICSASISQGTLEFKKKASMLLKEEQADPKCFAESKEHLTCFWEEYEETAGSLDQYSFTYTYKNEKNSTCTLRVITASGGKKLFVCHLSRIMLFTQMKIQVHREGIPIHNRSLFIDHVFFLDPPANVTVNTTGQPGQLNISWVPPPLKYMLDSMVYEVLYAPADSHVVEVEVAHACSELILRGLLPGTKYLVQVRVKLDGVTFDGYWSAWSDPVFMETLPPELDPLIVSLTLIISFILSLLFVIILLSHQRFLIKKIWPAIPTPESKFQGLFTTYGGNFEEWLGQTSGGLWLTPAFVYSDGYLSSLEVLSELSFCPLLTSPTLPPKSSKSLTAIRGEDRDRREGVVEEDALNKNDLALTECRRTSPPNNWLMDRLRAFQQHYNACSQSSLLESQDTYVMLSGNKNSEDEPMDKNLEEALPLEVFFASRKTPLCESHSDLGSVQQSSGSGRLSSQSSFEYPNLASTSKDSGYTYMAVADSGVSMDYSPMSRVDEIRKGVCYANEYKNEIPAHRRPLLVRQYPVHEDG